MAKSVLLIGATGLVGNITLRKLLQNDAITEVRIITRRATGLVNGKLKELVIDFEKLHDFKAFMQCDVFISCLGSTMKKAGSKKAFEHFDYYYPLELAKTCKEQGTQKMVLLSSMGADKGSLFFYNKIKGRLEEECENIGFDSLVIIQPSLILGDRKEKRAGERITKSIMTMAAPLLPSNYKPVSAETVSNTIVSSCLKNFKAPVERIRYKNFVA
jgi:uncharacterized protein YbjT (DUF2867 family)